MAKLTSLARVSAAALIMAAAAGGAAQAQLNQALQIGEQATRSGAQAQNQINDIDDQADELAGQYRAVLQEAENLSLVVDQRRVFLRSQQNEIDSLNEQIERVETVENELLPMMREMVASLENFIMLDMPFQREERLDVILLLNSAMEDPEVTPAEVYRLIITAYENEEQYGRFAVAYDDTIEIDGTAYTGEILRIGRVAMVFKIGDDTYYNFNRNTGQWEPLSGFRTDLQAAARIAKELTTPGVFLAPIPGAEQAG